jgi:hypothetical protein
MYYPAWLVGAEDVTERFSLRHVGLDESESGMFVEMREPGALQCGIVVLVETIEPDHLLATFEQA